MVSRVSISSAGLKVSKPGIDVLANLNDQTVLGFDSRFKTLRRIGSGSTNAWVFQRNVAGFTMSLYSAQVAIPDTGRIPLVVWAFETHPNFIAAMGWTYKWASNVSAPYTPTWPQYCWANRTLLTFYMPQGPTINTSLCYARYVLFDNELV